MRQPFTIYPVWKKRTGHAFICGWLGFCHGVSAGNFLKKSVCQLQSGSQICKLASWVLFTFKGCSQNTFQACCTDLSRSFGSGLLVLSPASKLKSVQVHKHPHWKLFFFPLLPFLTIPFGSFIFLNIQQKYSLRTKYLSNVQLEGPSRLWLKSPEANDKRCCSTTHNTNTENSGRQSIQISTKYTYYL